MVNSWKVILATLIIFGAGVVTGGLLVTHSHSVLGSKPNSPPRSTAVRDSREAKLPPLTDPSRRKFLDRLDRELQLAPDQRERIEAVLRKGQERTRDLLRGEMMLTRQKIRSELTPEQQTNFQGLLKKWAADQRRAGTRGQSTNTAQKNPTNDPVAPRH